MFYPSGLFRMKARAVLKNHWQTALLIALIVNLPTLLMQGFSAFTGNDLIPRLQSVLVASNRDGLLPQEQLLKEIDVILGSTGFWTMRGLELLAWLITPCLTLGMYRWLMNRVRGLEDPVSTVLCRMNQFFRAIGLQLLIILKILLWVLPGIAVSVYLLLPVYQSADLSVQLAALQRSYDMTLPVMLLIAVPGIMAALRYALSEYIMADEPQTRILTCIRHSKELMKDKKKDLFFLLSTFLLLYLLELMISSMLSGVLGLVFQMLAGLAISVYMSCSIAVFYLFLESGEKTPKEPEVEELN
ncbi:MAG: DUF975 family protein [Clostridia bacterium]|nr:DUF975 family protein [Clostridia bacterium]